MAMIKCTDCGAMISDQAKSCPNCGCPVEHVDQVEVTMNRPRRIGKWMLVVVIAILAIGSSAAYFTLSKDNIIKRALHKEPIVKLTPEFCKAVRKYNCLWDFENGFASVQNGEKWGAINTEGKEVVPCIYDRVNSFHDELAAVRKNDKWGYVNTKGDLVIPCIYEYANDFSDGFAAVRKNGKEGFVNKKGEVVIPLNFEECGIFSEGLAYAGDKTGNYFINTDGEKVITLPKDFTLFEGSAYDCRYPVFSNGICKIAVNSNESYNDNYYINDKGEHIAEPKSQNTNDTLSYEYEIFRNGDGLVGVKNVKTNKIVIPAKYSSINTIDRASDYIELHNGVVVATLEYETMQLNGAYLDKTENVDWNTFVVSVNG